MRVLHTSDWHLGRTLYGHKRYPEFSAFLAWIFQEIQTRKIDCLLIAGDVFDNGTPSNRAQELYYNFLCQVASSDCRHVVIIAGNHDSATFLNAPKAVLSSLQIHVVGAISENPEDEIIELKDKQGKVEALVCAIPYLRDRDIRSVEAGESVEDKGKKLILGIENHYQKVCLLADQKRQELVQQSSRSIPLMAMGHLFTAGGKTNADDGVRELYVGSLAYLGADAFPDCIDYLALGHLHVPQKVAQKEEFRYSGSPIPMGFGEAKQQKIMVQIDFETEKRDIQTIVIPCFQKLELIRGDLDGIFARILDLKDQKSDAWLEVEYTGKDICPNLRELVEDEVEGSGLEVRRIRNKRIVDRVIQMDVEDQNLEDIQPEEVFKRRLDAEEYSQESRVELESAFHEILQSINEEDHRAE